MPIESYIPDTCPDILALNLDQALKNYPTPVDMVAINLPSGYSVVIREQNGQDDSILSNLALTQDASGINKFVQGIILYSPRATGKNGLLTDEDILRMPLRDKYTILLKSRIFSLGPILKFDYTWVDERGKLVASYEEDISLFVWDYLGDIPYPTESNEDLFFNERMAPYNILPEEDGFIYMLSKSGLSHSQVNPEAGEKKLRFQLMDGFGEKYLLGLKENNTSINSRIIARNLQLSRDGVWYKVENFTDFTPREMARIRKITAEIDRLYDGLVEINHPEDPSNTLNLAMMAIPSFFFPAEIL